MPIRISKATWSYDLYNGIGFAKLNSNSDGSYYTHSSRFKNGKGTNPEELIGAALASCFSMTLANVLEDESHEPHNILVKVLVKFEVIETEPTISRIGMFIEAEVPNVTDNKFDECIKIAEEKSPIIKFFNKAMVMTDAKLI
ncbi:OsmC family peroxiredoxin [Aliifodinibius sp. S!AR15-10]|uniref:OsmC family peroxiredoxin n=1 Tax=Aliifodinibius sp. S!AR15-10 TaxID=2950437 RepID=UPI002862A761|nr:OsmC family peroxiredoxin [Aliifodinibius sp. S!AR15-10]MDR8389981.1 OsmC family peroxiredoxin [Aliifodinibius sp. S!AR15-10]